jgi:hypothetical protein
VEDAGKNIVQGLDGVKVGLIFVISGVLTPEVRMPTPPNFRQLKEIGISN